MENNIEKEEEFSVSKVLLNEDRVTRLEDKFNIKFFHLCHLFEQCLKGKTKSKVK